MKRLLTFLLLLSLLVPACAEEAARLPDTTYELAPLVTLSEGEELVLTLQSSYYSGETVYKGSTGKVLTGACALHCAAVVITNLTGKTVTAQEAARANNISKTSGKYWSAFVSWGKLGNSFGVDFESFDLAQYGSRLRANGTDKVERRQKKLDMIVEALENYAGASGLIVHFNATGQLNGSGKRHAVVVVGYIQKDGVVTDLLLSDSSVPAPAGACVRLSQSSLPLSMLGEKRLAKTAESELAALMMDYAVSYRYVFAE